MADFDLQSGNVYVLKRPASSLTPSHTHRSLMWSWDRSFVAVSLVLACVSLVVFPTNVLAEANSKGVNVYLKACQQCHGDKGQGGTEGYQDALTGDFSVGELTKIIVETMPEDDPDSCVGEEARAVAEYLHEAFYSRAAQLRNRPASIRFSRLTGTQLQQSLADLYQNFHGRSWRQDPGGLKALYFDAGRWDKKKLKVERVDPVLDFDFGRSSPVEGVSEKEFYINWSGSLRVEHTGRYEIIAESTCSMTMKFGGRDRKLIDNHVQSEGKTEFRRTVSMIAGRHYPISIEFIQRKRKTELPPAKFSLRWKPPGGSEEVIPLHNLVPHDFPSTFALQAKLPPDDQSYGYGRGTSVDRTWDESVTRAALEFGNAAATELWPHYKNRHRKDSDENRGRVRSFLTELVSVAFRGDLSDEIKSIYIEKPLKQEPDDQEAIRRVCLMTLKSPRFLYPSLDQTLSPSERVASRLALVMLDSLPTAPLSDTARKKQLNPADKGAENRIRRAAGELANDPRLNGKVVQMFYEWLDVDAEAEVSKDPKQFPGFDQQLVLDLRHSLDRLITNVFWSEQSDYRQLFRQDWMWTNQRLADFYGDSWSAENGQYKPHDLVHGKRQQDKLFGVLTHPLLLSHRSYYDTTSPIHRGVFLIRKVLGRTLRPPNEAFTPISPDLHPDLTTRQRVELQTGEAKCQVCHQKINPLGFTLENYDAVGRFREVEKNHPIDPTGGYVSRDGSKVEFKSAKDLALFLAENEDAHRAFIERAFEHFAKQPIDAYGHETSDRLLKHFRESQFNMRKLIVEIAVIVAMHSPESPSETGKQQT